MSSSTKKVIALVSDLQKGDAEAGARLMPLVYGELRRLAASYMRRERLGQTIQPTELVHEVYLRLVNQDIDWQGKAHFLALAAKSMRRILIERARRKRAEKHGGGGEKVELDEGLLFSPEKSRELIDLDEALTRLAAISPRQGRVVELRFFGGLSVEEIAAVEHIAPRTVKLDWSLARSWLHKEIKKMP